MPRRLTAHVWFFISVSLAIVLMGWPPSGVLAGATPAAGESANQQAATPAPTISFNNPLPVCDLLEDAGYVAVLEGAPRWGSIDGGNKYNCLSKNVIASYGNKESKVKYYLESNTNTRIELIELMATASAPGDREAVFAMLESSTELLFQRLGFRLPAEFMAALRNREEIELAQPYGAISVMTFGADGIWVIIELAGNATAGLPTVTPTPAAAAQPASPADQTPEVVVEQSANLRGGPGTNYPIMGSAAPGETFPVVGSSPAGDWFLLDNGFWIAAFLVSVDGSAAPIPTLPPTATPTVTPTPRPTPTPNVQATTAAVAAANATATIEGRVDTPPAGTWCAHNDVRSVCAFQFDYHTEMTYSRAASGSRYISFALAVFNGSYSDIATNPNDVTLVMANGNSYGYDASTFSYWDVPLEHVNIAPDDSAQGGLVFLVTSRSAPERIIYRGGFWEENIVIDLRSPPE